MKKLAYLPALLLFIICMVSCEKEEPEFKIVSGTYTGYFFRIGPSVDYLPSEVTLEFNGNKFEGSSSIEKYPAICRGTFEISGNEIEFSNACPWTAEFDWTYILGGKFEIFVEGTHLTLTRRYSNDLYDSYSLERQD
ncbi:hypothetical protein [Nafulsella turpanensis]|uniref:hypothetical protein n=1 Tax=Nafulsella turpanensis TaxID=1265690 RepID=UPI00034926B6|nr:hypothetical protein [Nafulsella turpanensis]